MSPPRSSLNSRDAHPLLDSRTDPPLVPGFRREASSYRSGKNKWRFFFKPAREFKGRDNFGQNYPEPWDELNININASPWSVVNRGMADLNEALSLRTCTLNSPGTKTFFRLHVQQADAVPNPL